jgi:hypothetical protein
MATYICAACWGQFVAPEGQEEQANREAKARYGKDGSDPTMAKVCDECFERLRRFEQSMARARSARWN